MTSIAQQSMFSIEAMENANKSKLNRVFEAVSRLIDTKGLDASATMLESLSVKVEPTINRETRSKILTSFIINKCCEVFDLDEEQFQESLIPEYRQGRMACYHLLKKHAKMSYSRIAEKFGTKKHSILYFHQKCSDLVSIPQYYREFNENYNKLEQEILRFIPKMES